MDEVSALVPCDLLPAAAEYNTHCIPHLLPAATITACKDVCKSIWRTADTPNEFLVMSNQRLSCIQVLMSVPEGVFSSQSQQRPCYMTYRAQS